MRLDNAETHLLATTGAAQGIWRYGLQPHLKANKAWVAMGVGILAYELAAPNGELLSEAADRAIARHPVISRLGIAAVALHLSNALPPQLDPIHLISRR